MALEPKKKSRVVEGVRTLEVQKRSVVTVHGVEASTDHVLSVFMKGDPAEGVPHETGREMHRFRPKLNLQNIHNYSFVVTTMGSHRSLSS